MKLGFADEVANSGHFAVAAGTNVHATKMEKLVELVEWFAGKQANYRGFTLVIRAFVKHHSFVF